MSACIALTHRSSAGSIGSKEAFRSVWGDEDCKVGECLSRYLDHSEDEKPITVRQCIKGAAAIAQAKPNLKLLIVEALRNANASRYSESMRPLIQADICDALVELDA